jgi:hypothetical protein
MFIKREQSNLVNRKIGFFDLLIVISTSCEIIWDGDSGGDDDGNDGGYGDSDGGDRRSDCHGLGHFFLAGSILIMVQNCPMFVTQF